ncbi:MAG: Hsp20/alpha crystallin family protein [Myxococcales bacterium]|nr:Hsp20/alpha crystallin family protein [Myxococcales bacterium]
MTLRDPRLGLRPLVVPTQSIFREEVPSMTRFRMSSSFDPVSGLLALQRELERVFDKPFGIDLGPSGRGVFPPVNVFADKDGYVMKLETPGVPPGDVHIEAEGRTLTVSGKREVAPPPGGSFHRRERGSGQFSRSFQLPADLDLSRADAAYKYGVLTIRVPKKEEAKPRQISVKAS